MYWHESMGRSETESFRVSMVVDFWSGWILHLETMVVLEEGISFVFVFLLLMAIKYGKDRRREDGVCECS